MAKKRGIRVRPKGKLSGKAINHMKLSRSLPTKTLTKSEGTT